MPGLEILVAAGVILAVTLIKTWINNHRANKNGAAVEEDSSSVVTFDTVKVKLASGEEVEFSGTEVNNIRKNNNIEQKKSTGDIASQLVPNGDGDPAMIIAAVGVKVGIDVVKYVGPKIITKAVSLFSSLKSTVSGWFGWESSKSPEDYTGISGENNDDNMLVEEFAQAEMHKTSALGANGAELNEAITAG